MIPFFSLPGLFTGPIANAIGGADISFVVGLIVAGGLYFLSRDLDLERRAGRHRGQRPRTRTTRISTGT